MTKGVVQSESRSDKLGSEELGSYMDTTSPLSNQTLPDNQKTQPTLMDVIARHYNKNSQKSTSPITDIEPSQTDNQETDYTF